ncbi:hypothetical protein [Streptomyces sp. NBC_00045]|uniref:hypothetical protein n=1 Tax=Streptomyces sp. NBC_00045 TaxID=2975625 RepID=UPI00386AA5ED
MGSKRPSRSGPTNSRAKPCAGNRPAASIRPSTGAATSSNDCFHRLKQWRGIATRYDKHPDRYQAAISLASTLVWLDK